MMKILFGLLPVVGGMRELALSVLDSNQQVSSQTLEFELEQESMHFRRRMSSRSDFSFATRFMLRTTDVPLGPKLNTFSPTGVVDQDHPLIGIDIVTVDGVTGFWPLFGTTQSNVYVDPTQSYWLETYPPDGTTKTSLDCKDGYIIVGMRYKSHQMQSADDISSLPDVQCGKLVIAAVNNYAVGATHEAKITRNSDGSSQVSTTDSTKNLQQCMLNAKQHFTVSKSEDRSMNTCPARVTDQMATSSSSYFEKSPIASPAAALLQSPSLAQTTWLLNRQTAPSFLLSRITSLHRCTHSSGSRAGLIDLLVRDDFTDIFGKESTTPLGGTDIAQTQKNSLAAAQQSYSSTWGETPPSPEEVKATLGPKPWESDQLIAASSEFLAGTLIGGNKVAMASGLSFDSTSRTITVSCAQVVGCEHGTCDGVKGCVCAKEYTGKTCNERKTPCVLAGGDSPCGSAGKCAEAFDQPEGYLCTCNEGFSGKNCEINSNVCVVKAEDGVWEDVKCGKGSCVPDPQYNTTMEKPELMRDPNIKPFMCKCSRTWVNAEGIASKPCSENKQDCAGTWTGGTCSSECKAESKFVVVNPQIGSGKACEAADGDKKIVDCNWGECKSCLGRNCNMHGACMDGVCTCDSGFTGPNCELEDNDCMRSRCNGHGSCLADGGCKCVGGWMSEDAAKDALRVSLAVVSPSTTTPLKETRSMVALLSGHATSLTAASGFCAHDPCNGCPAGQCDKVTGYCACLDNTFTNINRQAGEAACGKKAGIQDCDGVWSEWGVCGSDCQQRRYYSISSIAGPGGAACPAFPGQSQTQKCFAGTCCTLTASDCKNGGTFLAGTCSCACAAGWGGPTCLVKEDDSAQVLTREVTLDKNMTDLMIGKSLDPTEKPAEAVAQASDVKATSTMDKKKMMMMAGGAGVLLLIIVVWLMLGRKKKPEDPLAALGQVEGMEDLDMSALGLDESAISAPK